MENKEIPEGNKLIADFMQRKKDSVPHSGKDITYYLLIEVPETDNTKWHNEYFLEFNSSWDWLMPVIEKITELDITPVPNWTGYKIEIVPRGYVKITGFPMPPIMKNVSIEGSLINATWKAVVEFIKWYNNGK